MAPKKLATTFAALAIASLPLTASAGETPRGLWIKMKCALCHGEDGVGNTAAGRQKSVPDLRSDAIQSLRDDELVKPLVEGHAGLPPMQSKLAIDQKQLIISYIRALAPKKK